ncbi:MAG: hypothetical protein NZ455_09105 [Bacteroidia bacterium]|nr:hypothetical protein [Bacteroidia bacterium]MDW8346029.1 hypothetical protein [Bacteroidia bacterium]
MRRVREQCGAQHSTEAIAQPAARRPERKRGTRPKNKFTSSNYLLYPITTLFHIDINCECKETIANKKFWYFC